MNPPPRLRGPTYTGSDDQPYLVGERLRAAADAALFLGRPLLLTGEPGCGKTEFAYAAANDLGRRLERCQVRSDTTSRDLLYKYDAVRRLADAQVRDVRARDPRRYVELQPLGRALAGANPSVVLIDEVDKAPRDLPNDLLSELERYTFSIPEIADLGDETEPVRSHGMTLRAELGPPALRPLVIVTSNAEHQLPDPFLRRCVFHHLEFPSRAQLETILRHRHLGDANSREVFLDLFLGLRGNKLHKPPATSELIDWGQAVALPTGSAALTDQVQFCLDHFEDGELTEKSWHDLPGLACLIKLRQDLEKLARV